MLRLASLMVCCVVGVAVAEGPRALSPDGKLVVKANENVLFVLTGQPERLLMMMKAHRADITAVAFSPDGKLLISVDKDGLVNLFDVAAGKVLRKLTGPKGAAGLSVSPDGGTLSVKGEKATKRYNLITGAEVE